MYNYFYKNYFAEVEIWIRNNFDHLFIDRLNLVHWALRAMEERAITMLYDIAMEAVL